MNGISYNKADFMVSLIELEDFIQELDQRWTVKSACIEEAQSSVYSTSV